MMTSHRCRQFFVTSRTVFQPMLLSRPISFGGTDKNVQKWSNLVNAAEKAVGYPTSFMNLRFWLSDEMSNVAMSMRKLIGSKHPLMSTAKGLLFDNGENMQTRGLIVLLVSKAVGHPDEPTILPHHELDEEYRNHISQLPQNPPINGILPTQRSLAEITEMIHTAFVLHKGVMDLKETDKHSTVDLEDYNYGNKMAILSGDYLLAKASSGLASLGNTYVVEIMAEALSDLAESVSLASDLENLDDITRWKILTQKTGGCLYSNSCKSTALLAYHPDHIASSMYNFGLNFSWLKSIKYSTDSKSKDRILDQVLPLKHQFAAEAKSSLTVLQESEAKSILISLIDSME